MDGVRSLVGDYHGRSGSGGSTSSSSSSKYTATQLQKRQRLEQIALSLEEPARTRNSINSSSRSNNSQKSNKPSNRSSSNRRRPSSSSRSRAKSKEDETSTLDSQKSCIVCKRGVRNTRDLRHCFNCKKCSHATCNSGFVVMADTSLYACPDCLKTVSASTTLPSNNNVIATDPIPAKIEEDLVVLSDEDINRPSCSQSAHNSSDDDRTFANQLGSQKNNQTVSLNEEVPATKSKNKKSSRRSRTRSSPQQPSIFPAVRSNSSASEEHSSPVGNKLKTRISGSPSSISIGISMTTAEPSNDVPTPSETSLSPESLSDPNASRPNLNESGASDMQIPAKQPAQKSRARVTSQKKPSAPTNRSGTTMRTRFGGKPTPSVAKVENIYSVYERSGKYERVNRSNRKNGKGKGACRGGRRGKVISAFTKSRARQPQSSTNHQNSTDAKDGQNRLRSHDENDYIRTVVVTNSNDKFMDSVSLCLICGSVGQDTEGAMLTCASCAQSYHIFCINSKPNSTILERGWRCLDCTVCEGCGTDKDEEKILLCDDCDASFHIYCLEPKLTQIPTGSWRCKRCATCSRCKNQVPSSLDLTTNEGYCNTCFSLRKCPKCVKLYEAGDLLIKCQHCVRWYHARCEDLMTEEQVESASENSFRCTFCRPKMHSSYENSSLIMDNVMISRNTFDHVNTLRRGHVNLSFNDCSFRSSLDNDEYENNDDDGSYQRGGRGRGGAGRRVLKLGIGGFHVRMPRQRLPLNTPDEKDKELSFPSVGGDEEDQIVGISHMTAGKRMRRPRRPRRPKIEDAYPPAIQEAFFGIQPVDSRSLMDVVVDEPVLGEHYNVKLEDKNRNLGCELSDQAADAIRVDDLGLLDEILKEDIDIDIADLSLFMDEDDDNFNATSTHQFDTGFSSGVGMSNPFATNTNIQFGVGSVDNNFISDEQEHGGMKDEEDSDLTNEQFHAQMEQSHEKQRQIQQQARLHMGNSNNGQPNASNATETTTKLSANLSNADKINQATEKWEEDEPLGDKATKAAVLFANTQHGYLKEKFPIWSDRVKRINNLWRKLSPQERDVFVKKARENRAEVPKRRNRRATSNTTGNQVDDLGDASQDSNHSHLDNNQQPQQNTQRPQIMPVDPRLVQNMEPPSYPGNQNIQAQPYKVINPRHSGDVHINGIPSTSNVMPIAAMRQMPDPKMQMSQPNLNVQKEAKPMQTPMISAAEWERYNIVREQYARLNEQRAKFDEDLIKLRKVKKNVKAKIRSLEKSQKSHNIGYSNNELIENNAKVDAVTNEIAEKQKFIEKFKHDLKDMTTEIQNFESRYHLSQVTPNPLITPGMEPHPQMHFAPPQQMPYQAQPQQAPILSSPTYPFTAPPNMNPSFVPFRQNTYYESPENFAPNPSLFHQPPNAMRLSNFNNLQSTSPVLSNPETPPSARPTSSASTDIVTKSGRGRKRRRPLMSDEMRTPRLGHVFYNSLTDPFERDIYTALDMMIGWVEAAVDTGNESLFYKLQTMRTSNISMDQDSSSAYKAKRRRNIVKKPIGQEASEYEAFIEKLQTQLKLCPMPVLTYEQSSFIDTSIPLFSDLTKFQEEIGREFIDGSEIEDYHLNFMPDYYSHVEQQIPFDRSSLFPDSMSHIYADVDVDDLETCEEPIDLNVEHERKVIELKEVKSENKEVADESSKETTDSNDKEKEESESDKNDFNSTSVDNYELFWRNITSDEIGNSYSLPILHKANDDKCEFPILPHRSVFKSQKQRNLDHRYAVTLTIENINLDEKVLKELQNLINNPEDLEITEQTPPPESPQQAQEVKEEPMTEEIGENMGDLMCRQCDGLVKHFRVTEFMTKLGVEVNEDEELNSFCSVPCYLTYMAETNTPIAAEVYKHASRFVDESVVEQLIQLESTKKTEILPPDHELKLNITGTPSGSQTRTASLLSPIDAQFDPNYYSFNYSSNAYSNEKILRVCDLPPISQNTRSVIASDEYKWKGFGWRLYDNEIHASFQKSQEEMHQKLVALQTICSDRNRAFRKHDTRVCSFCREAGDGEQDITGRLLNIDANEWVHVNCALWSTEVFENENGVLKNVDIALKSAQTVQCKVCQRNGASLRCYKHNCDNSKSFYHLPCAKKANAKFGIDKLFYCPNHEIRSEVCLDRLATLRRICIEREETPLLAKIFNHSYPVDMMMRVGSMIFRSIGQVQPEQVKNFHNEEHIFPVGYHITRIFWSPFNAREQTRYECSISDEDGQPMFHVQMTESQARVFSDRSMAGAWNEIFQCVKRIRNKEVLQFYPDLMNASTLFGLQEPAITKIAESLPGVDQMYAYTISHENSPLLDLPLAINPTGCARCEPRSKTLSKHRSRPLITQSPRKKMVNTGNAANEFTPEIISREARRTRSQRCLFTSTFGDETLVQMMKRSGITENMLISSHVRYDTAAIHNAHSQYRKMKQEWRNNVYLGRSGIQGLGLYAKKDLDMNTIIIEYVGEMIRSELGEVREKKYLSQNRAIYLFRVDEEFIIDATMTGGLARYINHSCDPNCSTKILQYNDEKKIVIIANRPIKAGEELTYDYQFELEDDSEKIACLCGAPNCVRWMN